MLGFLKNSYAFAVVVALLTATLSWLYARTIEKDKDVVNKTFFKTLVAGLIAGVALAWFVSRPEEVMSEPYVE